MSLQLAGGITASESTFIFAENCAMHHFVEDKSAYTAQDHSMHAFSRRVNFGHGALQRWASPSLDRSRDGAPRDGDNALCTVFGVWRIGTFEKIKVAKVLKMMQGGKT